MKYWQDKPYNTLNAYCKSEYGKKIYKTSFDIGLTCPNRDGTLDNRGCIFCSEGGSGDFAVRVGKTPQEVVLGLKAYLTSLDEEKSFIGYFQAFTNTYGDENVLKQYYEEVLKDDKIVGISIATRPDCISDKILDILEELKIKYNKFIWIELGLQTVHEKTAKYIRRHYTNDVFEHIVAELKRRNILFIVHVILGLPGETKDIMLETIRYINNINPFGVKLQLLHVLKNTDLATDFMNAKFKTLELEEYIDIVISSIELLNQDIVLHRVTGDGPRDLLIEPRWSTNKKMVLNTLHKTMKQRESYQGKFLK